MQRSSSKQSGKSPAVYLLIVAGFVLFLTFAYDFYGFVTTPLVPIGVPGIEYTVTPGTSIIQLAHDLKQKGYLHNQFYFIGLARALGISAKAGEYHFEEGQTAVQVLKQIASGRVFYRQITFLEGWTFAQMMATIHQHPFITHTLKTETPEQVMTQLGHPGEHPEGRFFPDTYHFSTGTSDRVILKMAYRAMSKRLTKEWEQRDPAVSAYYPTPTQALIAASLIEREAVVKADRSKISAVLIHRLEKKMPLQFDSTVLYGLGMSNRQALRRTDLQHNTSYNTYVHTGLPPTPIGMPGLESIRAALHPAESSALYFVAKGDGSQAHQFSDNLTKHNTAVQQYRKQVKQQPARAKSKPHVLWVLSAPCVFVYPGYPHRQLTHPHDVSFFTVLIPWQTQHHFFCQFVS